MMGDSRCYIRPSTQTVEHRVWLLCRFTLYLLQDRSFLYPHRNMAGDHIIRATDAVKLEPEPVVPYGLYLIRSASTASPFAYLKCGMPDGEDGDEDRDGHPDDNKGIVKTARRGDGVVDHELVVCHRLCASRRPVVFT